MSDWLSELPEETLGKVVFYNLCLSVSFKAKGYASRLEELTALFDRAKNLRLVNTVVSRLRDTRARLYTLAWKIRSIHKALALIPPPVTIPGMGGFQLHAPPQMGHLAYMMYYETHEVVASISKNDPDALRGLIAHYKERDAHMQSELKRCGVLPQPNWTPATTQTFTLQNVLDTVNNA